MHKVSPEENIAKFSLKAMFFTGVGITLFGIYVGILIYGENSLSVLKALQAKKVILKEEGRRLKNENQKLQKNYFSLKQLVPKELEDGAL